MIKLLITGATGFLGINILRYLKRDSDIEIHILTRDKLKSADLIDIEQANIITYDEIMNFSEYDTILHLAGIAHNSKKVKDPEVYCKVNFELTKYLYENFLESRAGKFIFLSTVAVYGNSHTQVLTESCIPAPATDYSKSKLLAEEFIIAKEVPLKKSYYILRSALVFGPGNKGNFSSLSNFVSKGLPYPFGAFYNKRSFVSVENICFIIKELIRSDEAPSGVYNVADDDGISSVDLVSILARALGKVPFILNVPKSLVLLTARIGDILRLPINTELLEKLTQNLVVSNKKIKEVLKKELPLTTQEGLWQTVSLLRKRDV